MKLIYILLLLLILIVIEISLFISLYHWFGGWPILIGIVSSTVIGFSILYPLYFQLNLIRSELKTTAVGHRGEMIFQRLLLPFLSGCLLLFPGFFTDLLAILCFWPHLPQSMVRLYQIKSKVL